MLKRKTNVWRFLRHIFCTTGNGVKNAQLSWLFVRDLCVVILSFKWYKENVIELCGCSGSPSGSRSVFFHLWAALARLVRVAQTRYLQSVALSDLSCYRYQIKAMRHKKQTDNIIPSPLGEEKSANLMDIL